MKWTILSLLVVLTFGYTEKKQRGKNQDSSGMIEVDGIQFNYVRQGSGEPLVVIGSSVYYPKAFSESLKNNFDMVFIDSRHFMPNYDPSGQELDNINLSTFADDLEAARSKLNLGKIIVMGHSVHAQIALEYATKYPGNVKRLVLLCGVPYSFDELSEKANAY